MTCINKVGGAAGFPLFLQIHKIAFEGADPKTIIDIN